MCVLFDGSFFKLRGVFVAVVGLLGLFSGCCVLFWHWYVMWGLVMFCWVSLEFVYCLFAAWTFLDCRFGVWDWCELYRAYLVEAWVCSCGWVAFVACPSFD